MNDTQTTIAVMLMTKYHEGQLYAGFPYWYHLSDVMRSVSYLNSEDEVWAIAWLHDIIEDTEATAQTLWEAGLTRRVIDAVICLTKVEGESYDDYIKKVRSNPDALLVKKHDTLCNLTQSVKEGNSKRIKKYAKQLLLLEE